MVFAEQPGNYCFSKDFTLQHQAVPFKEGLGRFHIYIYIDMRDSRSWPYHHLKGQTQRNSANTTKITCSCSSFVLCFLAFEKWTGLFRSVLTAKGLKLFRLFECQPEN